MDTEPTYADITHSIAMRVIAYYTDHPPTLAPITHTQCVVTLTRLIAKARGYDNEHQALLEIAAWMQGIGVPAARNLYGNTLPVHCMKEAAALAHLWCQDYNLTPRQRKYIEDIISVHKLLKPMADLDALPLYEAEVIRTAQEVPLASTQAQQQYELLLTTKEGRRLYQLLCMNQHGTPT